MIILPPPLLCIMPNHIVLGNSAQKAARNLPRVKEIVAPENI